MSGSADALMVALWDYWKEGRGGSIQPDRAIIMQPYLTISRLTRRKPTLRAFLGLAALLLLTACSSQPTPPQAQNTHVPLPALPTIGALPGGAANAQPTGALPPNTRLQLTIGLATNRQALADDLAAIYNPDSPQYQHYLTPAQIASRYGAPQSAIDAVSSFLNLAGIQVVSTSSLRDALTIQATAAQIQQAFHISLQVFQQNGSSFFGPTGTLQLPSGVSQYIDYILGLSSLASPKAAPPKTTLSSANCDGAQGETPGQIAAAYGYSQAYQAGDTGKGMAIGVVEFNDDVRVSDLNTFLSCTTRGQLHRSIVRVNGGVRTSDEDSTAEATLDLEYLSTLVPDATLLEYQTNYCAQDFCDPSIATFPEGYANILNQIAKEDRVQVVSASWGSEENSFSQDEIQAIHQNIELLAVEGITFTAAAGDCGAYDGGNFGQLSVDYPATDPYTLAVGGTLLATDTQGKRLAEPAWSNSDPDKSQCSNDWGTGGGLSTVFDRPPWQAGAGVQNSYSDGKREVPDVSAISLNVPLFFFGKWYSSGGTSLASPVWAADITLLDQALLKHQKPLVGAPSTFYQVANKGGSLHPFFDVTQGNNLYYPATPGFDLATGLGAPDLIDFGKALGAF
ncbi:MAG TPA: S53 family peptidase [Ktedonobacterales bacterium]|nr:S53 family peptidase [Ktedonobacterales bacterium]